MFAMACRVSASTNSQRSSAASSWPTVVLPAPATPITTIISAVTMFSPRTTPDFRIQQDPNPALLTGQITASLQPELQTDALAEKRLGVLGHAGIVWAPSQYEKLGRIKYAPDCTHRSNVKPVDGGACLCAGMDRVRQSERLLHC